MIGRTEMHHQLFDTRAIALISAISIPCRQSGLAETVRWYRDNPPSMPEEFEEDIKAHYKTEERLAELDKAYRAQLAEVEHIAAIDTPMRIRKNRTRSGIIGADERRVAQVVCCA